MTTKAYDVFMYAALGLFAVGFSAVAVGAIFG